MRSITKSEESPRQNDLTTLSDPDLVRTVAERAAGERHATAGLIRALIEFDHRRLYLAEGYASLYAYCTQALHYSEFAAFNRIEVARAAARWPQLLARIEDGSLHLSGARLLAPHLTDENVDAALESATHKSKREIEEVVAGLAHRTVMVAVAAEEYRLHLTISRQARETLQELQELLSHQVPKIHPAVIVERALSLLLTRVRQERLAATERPRHTRSTDSRSRRIPAAVKREVWNRDGGRCAFVGRQGRCQQRHRIEFHHVVPFAAGGAKTASNIQLRCRQHNVYEAETYFGAETVAAARERNSRKLGKSNGGGGSPRGGKARIPAARPGTSPTAPRNSTPTAPGKPGSGRRREGPGGHVGRRVMLREPAGERRPHRKHRRPRRQP